ncbi:ABC transporter permease [Paraflavitalea pollutisoli]|uniref:ABC transporter permease n=1 Tax=Paraflavitalea pollutisoli TaxID=3034143 RepID=UPI0023EAB948|nr:ABC transporter permease [Paraflavitalea sp. H1-2-19X]
MLSNNTIFTVWQLTKREAARIGSDHSLLLTLLIAPLLYAFFYGSIYTYKEEEGVQLAIVDDDRTSLSRLLAQQIGYAQVTAVFMVPTIEDAKEAMYQGQCQGFLYIEKGLEQRVKTLRQAHVVVALNAARFLPSSDLLLSINQTCLTIGAGVRLQYLQKSEGMNTGASMQEVMPVNLDYRPLFNSRSSYGAFLLPGLLALILQQTLLIGLSASVSAERKKNRVGTWMATARYSLSAALWGKGLFYILLYAVYAYFFMTVNYTLLELPMRGNGWHLTGAFALFILTLIPMAQWIGSLFKDPLLNVQFMAFSTYPFFLITGYTFPLQNIPQPLQWLSALLPTTPFINMYQSIVQAGGTLFQNGYHFIHLLLLLILYTAAALYRLERISRI